MKKLMILILLCMLQTSIITADIFTAGGSGGNEIIIGGNQMQGFFTGIPEEEAPPSEEETPSNGRGGPGKVIISNFKLDKTFFSVEMKKGEHYQEQIIITNTGTKNLTINISSTLEKYIFPAEESFILKVGEIKNIKFDIYVSEKEKADVYIGKINFNSKNIKKSVNVVLDIKEKAPLFDIKTIVSKKYILPGGKVTAKIIILNLGDLKNIDVELEYHITDFDNKIYSSKKESLAINDSFKGEVFLETPKDIKVGKYLFYSKVNYGEISAASYDTFSIIKETFFFIIVIILSIFILITLLIIILRIKKEKKKRLKQMMEYENIK